MLRSVTSVALALIAIGVSLAGQLAGGVRTEAPVQRGTGATLVVTAPEALCRDDIELMVSRTVFAGRNAVFQTSIAPPVCQWVIEDARPGEYQAVLQMARGDRRIVAMSQLDTVAGVTSKVTIQALDAAVEGLISVAGIPIADARVEVKQNGPPGWSWETRTDASGYYKVTVNPSQSMCVWVRLPESINTLTPERCRQFGPGTNRQDLDAPPGRIQIELIPRPGPILETPVLLVLDWPGGITSVPATIAGPTRRSFVGLVPGKHTVAAVTMDRGQTFDTADVVLTRDDPVRSVTLSVPYSRGRPSALQDEPRSYC